AQAEVGDEAAVAELVLHEERGAARLDAPDVGRLAEAVGPRSVALGGDDGRADPGADHVDPLVVVELDVEAGRELVAAVGGEPGVGPLEDGLLGEVVVPARGDAVAVEDRNSVVQGKTSNNSRRGTQSR